jgi:hypothetical protein
MNDGHPMSAGDSLLEIVGRADTVARTSHTRTAADTFFTSLSEKVQMVSETLALHSGQIHELKSDSILTSITALFSGIVGVVVATYFTNRTEKGKIRREEKRRKEEREAEDLKRRELHDPEVRLLIAEFKEVQKHFENNLEVLQLMESVLEKRTGANEPPDVLKRISSVHFVKQLTPTDSCFFSQVALRTLYNAQQYHQDEKGLDYMDLSLRMKMRIINRNAEVMKAMEIADAEPYNEKILLRLVQELIHQFDRVEMWTAKQIKRMEKRDEDWFDGYTYRNEWGLALELERVQERVKTVSREGDDDQIEEAKTELRTALQNVISARKKTRERAMHADRALRNRHILYLQELSEEH